MFRGFKDINGEQSQCKQSTSYYDMDKQEMVIGERTVKPHPLITSDSFEFNWKLKCEDTGCTKIVQPCPGEIMHEIPNL